MLQSYVQFSIVLCRSFCIGLVCFMYVSFAVCTSLLPYVRLFGLIYVSFASCTSFCIGLFCFMYVSFDAFVCATYGAFVAKAITYFNVLCLKYVIREGLLYHKAITEGYHILSHTSSISRAIGFCLRRCCFT